MRALVHGRRACGAASTPSARSQVTSTDPFGLARRTHGLRRAHAGDGRPGGHRPAAAHQLRRRGRRHAAHHEQPARPGRRQPRSPVRTCRATRCAASTGGRPRTATSSWCARRSRSPRPRRRVVLDRGRAAVVARGDAGARRRSRIRGRRLGVRVGRSRRLVHDGYAVEVHRLRRHRAGRAHRRRRHDRGRRPASKQFATPHGPPRRPPRQARRASSPA